MTPAIIHGSIKGCDDIFWRYKGLDVMYRCKYKPATWRQVIDAAFHFVDHFLRFAKRQNMLGIHSAAPKHDIPSKFGFQLLRIHAFCRNLHWIEDIKADIDQVGISPRVAPQL